MRVLFVALALTLSFGARAEVFCQLQSYQVESTVNGSVILEAVGLVGSGSMLPVSLCGGGSCDSRTADRNMSLAVTAQARGVPLTLYYISGTSCSAMPYASTPFWIGIVR